MQIVRTILWILLAVFVVIFVMLNFGEPQRVKIWPSEDPVGFDWPVGIIALVFWLLGVVPTWIYHRSIRWSLNRRIRSLESSVKSNALAHRPAPGTTEDDRTLSPPVENAEENPANHGDNLTPDRRHDSL